MPLDQIHEQENAQVNGEGDIIGLTESQEALQQWMVCGPEIAKCLSEFETHELLGGDETPASSHHELLGGDETPASSHHELRGGDETPASSHHELRGGDETPASSHHELLGGDETPASSHHELLGGDETPASSHHEEGSSIQVKMKELVKNLIDTITSYSNPFDNECAELLVLNTRACMDESVIDTVQSIKAIGNTQYKEYISQVIVNRTSSIHDTIKKNLLPLSKSSRCKSKSKSSQKLVAEQHNASLFSHIYIASQQHNGDLATFFSHENQSSPPSLSDCGKLRVTQKSTLLNCFGTINQPDKPSLFDAKILDGSAVVHFLPIASAKTFNDYADNVVLPYLIEQLQSTSRFDCVWDLG